MYLILLLVTDGTIVNARAQFSTAVDRNKEYNVKGAYVYSFGRYATWPADTWRDEREPFVIGVYGLSRIQHVLDRIAKSKLIDGRPIQVRDVGSLDDGHKCQILFVAQDVASSRQQEIIQHFRNSAVLLVGESSGFAHWGGVVNFYLSGGAVRFEINVEAARRRGISMDAKLLRIAQLVSNSG